MCIYYGKILVNQWCCCTDLSCKVSCAELLFLVIDLISLDISQESKMLYNQIHADKKETLITNIALVLRHQL